jgi:SpoIVB peptidase S55
VTRSFVLLVLALAGPLLPVAAAAANPVVPTLDVEGIHAGQKAVVKTVFEGDRVEEFDAEIVGVLHGGRVEGDMILARATSERVVRLGVAAGMSGSPVYVEGRLIGALSSGWNFSREPLFGITPIREMLAVLDQPTQGQPSGTAGPTGAEIGAPSGSSRFGEFSWDDRAAEPLPAASGAGPTPSAPGALDATAGMTPLRIPLACSGLDARALEPLGRELQALGFAVVPGGKAEAGGPPADALVPGAAVAVDVLRGDLLLSAIGTVTYRDGDKVLIFGHPFFQSGEVRLPLSTASITTVVASQMSSFKLGVTGREAGVVTQDRRAAVAGRIGGAPRLLPVSVAVRGAARETRTFRFESIEDRALAPQLIALATMNSVLESGGAGASQTVRWKLELNRRGANPLTISDVSAGDAPVGDFAGSVAAPLRFLFNNPFERLTLDSVRVTVEVEPGRDQWTLRGARVLDAAVRPGGKFTVRCELERWHGEREEHDVSLTVPEEVPEGRYLLWVGGGEELSRYEAARLPWRYRPTSLDDAWRRLGALRPGDALYAALFARAPEVTSDGRDYPELPVSALALLAGGQTAGAFAGRGELARLDEKREPLAGEVHGELQLQVTVDQDAP